MPESKTILILGGGIGGRSPRRMSPGNRRREEAGVGSGDCYAKTAPRVQL